MSPVGPTPHSWMTSRMPAASGTLHAFFHYRLSRVRRHPEEEVTREEDASGRPPQPGVIVRLAASVRELERDPADLEGMRGVVHGPGVLVVGGPGSGDGELTRVDEPVPGRRHPVPVEAGGALPEGDSA